MVVHCDGRLFVAWCPAFHSCLFPTLACLLLLQSHEVLFFFLFFFFFVCLVVVVPSKHPPDQSSQPKQRTRSTEADTHKKHPNSQKNQARLCYQHTHTRTHAHTQTDTQTNKLTDKHTDKHRGFKRARCISNITLQRQGENKAQPKQAKQATRSNQNKQHKQCQAKTVPDQPNQLAVSFSSK